MQSQSKLNASAFFTALMFGFMYLPIAVLTFYSFNEAPNSAQWKGFTFSWYVRFFQDSRILSALWDSLLVASLATGIAAVIGTLMAIGLARYQFFGRKLFQGAAYLPLIIPDIAIAVATLVFLAVIAVPLSLGTIVAAHVVFCLAYVALVVSTRLTNLDPHLEEAALDLGATPFQSLTFVLLPQLAPAIVSGCLLAFILSMDDFLISSFTAGGGVTTLPMEIFSRIRTSVRPDMNALSVVLMIASAGIALIAEMIRYRSEKRRFQ
ncbi:ABC transporter permease [Leptolyngbya sp. AN03gr2]|uniref:ABC transporter permease n=1 Tax=unclassified Leptolyngbya TaxID=2650499 RepID=UPI003D31FF66